MSNTLQAKTIAVLTAIAMLGSLVFALPARAQSVAELQAQIQSLLQTIAALQAQMAALQGGSGSGAGTVTTNPNNPLCGFTFTKTHKMGDRGGEVKQIQMFLNSDADTRVAATGPGSTGNETDYFGPATYAAVKKFQAKYATAILAPVGLSAPTGVWGPSTRAKANALVQAMCAASNNTGAQTSAMDGLMVAAASQPANTVLPKGASNIPFTRFTLTAGNKSVTVDSVTVELTGLVDVDAFDAVKLLDEDGNLIGNEERFDDDTRRAEIGDTFKIKAGQSKTFTVVADRSTTGDYAGQVASIAVVAVNTDENVTGTLPITGAQHTINETIVIANANVNVNNEDGDVNIGDEEVTLATVELNDADSDANNNDVVIKRLRLHQEGSADLTDALDNVKVEIDGTEYSASSVSDEYIVFDFGSGVDMEIGDDIELMADIVGTNDTLQFEIENDADIVLLDKNYGYAAHVNNITDDTATDELTIKGGVITLDENDDWDAANVAVGENEAVIGSFVISVAGGDLEADVEITIEQTNSAGGDYEALQDVALYDKDGKRISEREDANITSSATSVMVKLDNVDFPEGEDMVYYVKADISDDAEDGDEYQITKIYIEDVDDNDRNATKLSLDSVEVSTAQMAISLQQPDDTSVGADQDEVPIVKVKVDTAGSAYDMELRKLNLKLDVVDAAGGSTTADESDVTNCALYTEDGDDMVSEVEDPNSNGELTYSFPTNPEFDKESISYLILKCDLSADLENNDEIKFVAYGSTTDDFEAKGGDIVVEDDVTLTAVSGSNNAVKVTGGEIEVTVTNSPVNEKKVVKTLSSDVVLGEFEIKAVDRTANIRGLQVAVSGDSGMSDLKVKVDGVLKETKTAGASVDFNSVSFNLDHNETVIITVLADLNSAETTGMAITDINVDLNNDDDYTDTGEDLTISGTPATVDSLETVPVITQIDVDEITEGPDRVLLAYKIKADGTGNIVISATDFEVIGAGSNDSITLTDAELRVYSTPDRTGVYTSKALDSNWFTADSITIDAGDTYSFEFVADVSSSDANADLVVAIKDNDANGTDTITFSTPANKYGGHFLEDDIKEMHTDID